VVQTVVALLFATEITEAQLFLALGYQAQISNQVRLNHSLFPIVFFSENVALSCDCVCGLEPLRVILHATLHANVVDNCEILVCLKSLFDHYQLLVGAIKLFYSTCLKPALLA